MLGRSSWLLVAVLLGSTIVSEQALAQGRPRVAIVDVQGPQARKVEGYIEAALRDEAEVVDAGDASAPSSNSGFAELAERLDVQALITARIDKGRRFVVTVSVRQGRDGSVMTSATWAEKKPQRLSVIARELWSKLGSEIASAEGPTPPAAVASSSRPARGRTAAAADDNTTDAEDDGDDEESDDEEESEDDEASTGDEEEAEEEASGDSDGRRPALVADLGVGPMWRDQAYNDSAMNAPFRYYNEMGSPALWVSLSVGFYPLALSGDGMLSNLGLVAGFGTALGLKSTDETGAELDTGASAFHVGVRGRLPLDGSELGLTVAYGARSFSTEAPDTTPIPDVSHSFLRLAGDGHIGLSEALGLELNLGYLLRLGSGELEDAEYFPELSGGGVELGLAGVFALGDSGLSLRASFEWQRFFFSLNPEVGAQRVVGGAVDNYYTFLIGARYALTTR